MFNFVAVNSAEVNAGIRAPEAPVLSINASEDINVLSWTSPYFTDFFVLYWSDNPFTSIDEPGVHAIESDMPSPGADPSIEVTFSHTIPAAFSLSIIYYRVGGINRFYSSTLSNQVDNYNFKLAIYEEIYKKTLDEMLLRFTPEIRRQYEDSELWKSFVQSLCSELAQSRFEIKEALKQLNLQKAIDVFLNMWYKVTGISRISILNVDTNEMEVETDAEYRQRLVDNIFWDKISNLALKKTMLLKLGIVGDVVDAGMDASNFKEVPERAVAKYQAAHSPVFLPGEAILFTRSGPNASATVVSDDGTTLTFTNFVYNSTIPGTGAGWTCDAIWVGSVDAELFLATPTGAAIGPPSPPPVEIMVNGYFYSGSAGWSTITPGAGTVTFGAYDDPDWSPPTIYNALVTGDDGTLRQAIATTPGQTYSITWSTYSVFGTFWLNVSSGAAWPPTHDLLYTARTTHGPHYGDSPFNTVATTHQFTATSATTYIDFHVPIVGYYGSLANVSCINIVSLTGIEATITHGPVTGLSSIFFAPIEGQSMLFTTSTATGSLISDINSILTFSLAPGSPMPVLNDIVALADPIYGTWAYTVLSDTTSLVSSSSSYIHSKLLSNIYSVGLGVSTMPDVEMNELYEQIYPLAAIGNVLTKILKDTAASFNDWNTGFGNIAYGEIFMGDALPGSKSTESNWAVAESLYISNQWTMSDERIFSANDGPDDIVTLTRTL